MHRKADPGTNNSRCPNGRARCGFSRLAALCAKRFFSRHAHCHHPCRKKPPPLQGLSFLIIGGDAFL